MGRFLVEVSHEGTVDSCNEAAKVFMESGSHFMTHADYGCDDNVHKSWMIVELDSKEMALSLLPPAYRHRAEIVKLSNYGASDFKTGMERGNIL